MSPRRYWAATLAAAVAVSVAGNVGHALLTAPEALQLPAAVAAALPPLALLVVTEGLVRTAGHGVRRWAYRAGVAGAVAIAGLAFLLSFAALQDLAIALGQPATVAAGWPLLADAAIAVSSIMLLATKPAATAATAATATGHGANATGHAANDVAAPPTTPAEQVAAPRPADVFGDSTVDFEMPLSWNDSAPATSGAAPATPATQAADVATEPAAAHMPEAARLVAGRVVRAEPVAVATALATLDAGGSQRAAAAASGLHRSAVAKIVAATSEPAGASISAA